MNNELQYLSKLTGRWVDFKPTDNRESLKKCGYKIREKPMELPFKGYAE